jgi:hypothetical protein
MMKARVRIGLLLVVLALAVVALIYRSRVQAFFSGSGKATARLVGQVAPELPALRALDGPPVRLADLRGRVTLLHFWTYG